MISFGNLKIHTSLETEITVVLEADKLFMHM